MELRDRAFVLAAVRALGPDAVARCATRAGVGATAAALAERLLADAAAQAGESTALDATPTGLERVHPSWRTPAPATSDARVRRNLERGATGRLAAMAPPGGDRDPLTALEALDERRLTEVLERVGAVRLAIALDRSSSRAVAQVCARLGEPAGERLLAAWRQSRATERPESTRLAARTLLTTSGALESGAPAGELLLLAAATWLGPALARRRDDRLRRVAQRLPRAVGMRLIAAADIPLSDEDLDAAVAAVAAALAAT